jgi:antitoxin PrlF
LNKEKEEEKGCGIAVASKTCQLEALVSVDERGQIVLPKDVREKAGIKAGDKLAVFFPSKKGEKVCCIMLMRVDELAESIKKTLGPLLQEILK